MKGRRRSAQIRSVIGRAVLVTALLLLSINMSVSPASAQDSILDSSALRSGEVEKVEDTWWNEIIAEPNSLISQVRLLAWNRLLTYSTLPPRTSSEWRKLLSAIDENGWTARTVRWRLREALRRERTANFPEGAENDDPTVSSGLEVGSHRRWAAVGPFGIAPASALVRRVGIELSGQGRRYDPETEFLGVRDERLRWRTFLTESTQAQISPRDHFGRSGAVYFFTAQFDLNESKEAWFQIATRGSLLAWIDGEPLVDIDRVREYRPTVVRRKVRLTPGRHRILIKTAGASFSALWRDPRGFPVALTDAPPLHETSTAPRGSARVDLDAAPPNGLAAETWSREFDSGQLPGEVWLPLAVALIEEGNTIRAHRVIEAIEARDNHDPVERAMFATTILDRIEYLPSSRRRNTKLAWWKSGLAEEPNNLPLGLTMVRYDANEDRATEAWARLSEIRLRNPSSLEAALLAERISDERGWDEERRLAIADIERLGAIKGRENPRAIARLIDFSTSQGRDARRTQETERLFRVRPSLRNAERLVRQWASVGRRQDAIAVVDALSRLGDGNSLQVAEIQARLWKELGRVDSALASHRTIASLRSDSAAGFEALGDLAWEASTGYESELSPSDRQTLREEAIEAYRKALEISPGRVALIDRLEELEHSDTSLATGEFPAPSEPFWKPYAMDGSRAIREAPEPGTYPRAAAVLLIDQMVTRIRRDGGGDEMIHQVIHVTSREAVEKYSELTLSGEIERLRVLTPDGEELHPTAQVGGGSFTLPGLAEGSFIEYRTVRKFDLARQRDLTIGPFFLKDPSGSDAFHYTDWTVLLPETWSPRIVERNLSIERAEQRGGGYRVLRWIQRAVSPAPPEFRSPPTDIVLPNIQIRADQNWAETMEVLQANAAEGYRVTPVLERAVAEVCGSTTDTKQRVLQLYSAVCERIKSDVGGDGASEIWLEEGGSRDRALAGLLAAAEIPFQWIYAARADDMRPFGDWTVPTTGHFEYPFLRVDLPDGPLFITTRFRKGPAGRIPRPYQGARAVAITATGEPEWIELPSFDRRHEARVAETRVRLGNANATAEGALELRMVEASSLKDQLAGINDFQRQSTIEGLARQSFPGATSIAGDLVGLDSPSDPLRIVFSLQSSQLVQRSGDQAFLRPIYFPSLLRRSFVRKGSRTLPYVGETQDWIEEHNEIDLGQSYRLVRIPDDCHLVGPWGSFQMNYNVQGQVLRVSRILALQPFVIDADRVDELYEFCAEVDRKESEQIRIQPIADGDG